MKQESVALLRPTGSSPDSNHLAPIPPPPGDRPVSGQTASARHEHADWIYTRPHGSQKSSCRDPRSYPPHQSIRPSYCTHSSQHRSFPHCSIIMPPKPRKSSAATRSAPATPTTGDTTNGNIAPSIDDLPDTQSTTISDATLQLDSENPSPAIPALGGPIPSPEDPVGAFALVPHAPAAPPVQPSIQADVASLSDNQSSAEKNIKDNAIACARNRLEDRRQMDARLAELEGTLRQLLRDGAATLKRDIVASQDGIEGITERIQYHDSDLEGLLTESTRLAESIDRLNDHLEEKLHDLESDVQTVRNSIRDLKLDVQAQFKARRAAQERMAALESRLATIQEDILPAVMDGDAAGRSFGDRHRVAKGKQRATSSDYEYYGYDEATSNAESRGAESDPDGWGAQLLTLPRATPDQLATGEPSTSTTQKRQMDFTPEKRDDHAKRAREADSPLHKPISISASTSLPVSLVPTTSTTPLAPPPPPPAHANSIPARSTVVTNSNLPPVSQASSTQGPSNTVEPDLSPVDAMSQGITRIIMKNLDGTDFFSASDKVTNYNLFRKLNVYLAENCAPEISHQPDSNTLISTTETAFGFSDPSHVRSLLAAWRFRPDSLHNFRIYRDSSISLYTSSQPPSQLTTLQAIMAIDTSALSRGRGRPRGTRGSMRGAGRGRGGNY